MLHVNFGEYGNNFWKSNPGFYDLKTFRENFYDKDRKRGPGKKWSSDIMWFAVYFTHHHSRFINFEEEERKVAIGEEVIQDANFYKEHKEDVDFAIKELRKYVETAVDKQFRAIKKLVDKRVDWLEQLDYEEHDPKLIDEAIKTTKDITKQYQEVEAMMMNKQSTETRGGSMPSAADLGEI